MADGMVASSVALLVDSLVLIQVVLMAVMTVDESVD